MSERPISASDALLLDPSVTIEALPARKQRVSSDGPPVRRGWLLLHTAFQTAVVMPPGAGLDEFVASLRAPVEVSELVDDQDIGTGAIAWQLVDNLLRRGFAYRVEHRRAPTDSELTTLRQTWREQRHDARRTLRVSPRDVTVEALARRIRDQATPPRLVITCTRDPQDTAWLESLVAAWSGDARGHELIVEHAEPATDPRLRDVVRRLNASLRYHRTVDDLAAAGPAVAEVVAAQIPVIVRLALGVDDLTGARLDEIVKSLVQQQVTALELDVAWGTFDGADVDATAEATYARVEAVTAALGDVRIVGFPTDDDIAGESLPDLPPSRSALERAVRMIHLRRRAHAVLDIEGNNVWAQTPAAEELWVAHDDDLLPNRPDLLGLVEGAVVVDIAGGFGRVARRLAPHVGATGVVITIDKEPTFSARARRFALQEGARSIQFRIGLCQRLPLAADSVDAAVLEWGGQIHRDGLLSLCVAEMRRVLRPGKRFAITYRLTNITLANLTEHLAPYPDIYPAILQAVDIDGVKIVAQKFWGVRPRLSEAPQALFEERFLPRIVDDLGGRKLPRQPDSVDVSLTVVAEKLATS